MRARVPARRAVRRLAILVVLLLAAFALRVWDLGGPSVWHDEAWSIRAIRDPIGTPDDNTPPAYYMLMHLLWRGAGDSAVALRAGSALLDLLTVALAGHLARRWLGRDAAVLAVVLFGASPLLWAYAREIRAYVAVPLLALILLRQADVLLAPGGALRARNWLAVLVPELILLYTHNLSVPVVAWLNFAVVAAWIGRRAWRWLGIWLAGQGALLLLYLPWLLGQSPSGTPLNTPPRVRLGLAWDIWQAYFAPVPVQIGAENALTIGSAVFAAAAILAAGALLAWNRRRFAWLTLSQAALLPALATVELLVAHIDFHPRYFIAGVPATLLVVALGAQSIPNLDLRRLAGAATVALAAGVGAASLIPLFDTPRYQHDDFRALAAYYAELPPDAIILVPYGWEPALEEYYLDRFDVRAAVLGLPLHSPFEEAAAAINEALAARAGPVRIELLTWYQLPADERGMLSCLLEAAGERTGDAFTVQGLTTVGYEVARPVTFADVMPEPVDYGRLRLDGAALAGEASVCLRTRWTLQQPAGEAYRVAARVLTTEPGGWVIARDDRDIRRDDQAATPDWEPGDAGEGYSLLRLPPGTPPGDYTLHLTVYSAGEPDGLDRLEAGVPAGRVASLGTVTLAGAAGRPFTDVPVPVGARVAEGVELRGYGPAGGTLNPGQELRITLYWAAEDAWDGGTLRLSGEGWALEQPVTVRGPYHLGWHAFTIPAEASGPARLALAVEGGDEIELAAYDVEAGEHLFAPPPFDVAVDAAFGDVARLVGFSVADATVSPDGALDLTLVWQAERTAGTSYKVFTHLLDDGGQVIAQHDGYPVAGERLATGWLPGEYLIDAHALQFERRDYRGPARLEVGLYDPESGERVRLSDGADHVILPIAITVE